jgi:hypothetical protein
MSRGVAVILLAAILGLLLALAGMWAVGNVPP